jgi:hypothetical protein
MISTFELYKYDGIKANITVTISWNIYVRMCLKMLE